MEEDTRSICLVDKGVYCYGLPFTFLCGSEADDTSDVLGQQASMRQRRWFRTGRGYYFIHTRYIELQHIYEGVATEQTASSSFQKLFYNPALRRWREPIFSIRIKVT